MTNTHTHVKYEIQILVFSLRRGREYNSGTSLMRPSEKSQNLP